VRDISHTQIVDQLSSPIFIVGAPRSGTTLVARILDSHSRIAIYHETQYYPLLRADLHRYGDLRQLSNMKRFIDDLRELTRELQGVPLPPTKEFIDALIEPTFQGVLATLLRLHARTQGKSRCGEKTPRHHAYLAEILEGLPRSPVIFVLRDPRDTVLSIRRAFRTNLRGAVGMCREAFASYQKFSTRVHTIRYEDLAREPRKTIEAACAYLDEPFEPGMLHFFERVPDRMGAVSHHSKLLKAVDADSIGNFAQMSGDDIRFIEAACREVMIALGYPFSAKPETLRIVFPSKLDFMLNRLRYYGWSWRRWRRGWARWRIVVPLRIRYFLMFGWLAR
jgi:hypothetical protein